MNKDKCRAITSPGIPLREKLFFRMIYETRARYNRWTATCVPRAMKLTLRHFEKMIDKRADEHPEDVSLSSPAAVLMCLRRLCSKVWSGRM